MLLQLLSNRKKAYKVLGLIRHDKSFESAQSTSQVCAVFRSTT